MVKINFNFSEPPITPYPISGKVATFWKLYDEYETQRKELGKQRIELLKQYADQCKTMTGEQADARS